ncbi:glycosyltransferase family 2 protein [Agrococcus baldri]|uniref:Polysaccharide synthesis protein GtrA n=1 Tax=Agrococcus baldri TaxID=153730 RepID=A0AA87UY29_9MICO|nr:glycosyltransferase family 2 protein [Agrococcus baldri]GEK80957.1 polysaccharide synthesis protein GtrA [Agrococcus baldri]
MAVVVIPALEPDERLVALVEQLAPRAVVIVDDGSGPAAGPILAAARELGATVLRHPGNRGKGAALRTAIDHVRAAHPGQHVVTADCDGQHRPADIAAVEAAIAPGTIVLGERRLTGASAPMRSRIGNAASRALFALASGVMVADAQTGLRGIPADALDWVRTVPGDRFEHEQRVLLEAARRRLPLVGVPIAAVYLDGNASSHFRPLTDSVRVVAPLLAPLARFAALGIGCLALDALLVVVLAAAIGSAGVAAVLARLGTATVHFLAGRRWVFGAAGPLREQLRRYALLAAGTVLVGAIGLELAVAAGAALLPAKLAIDAALAVLTYLAQRFGVFIAEQRPRRPAAATATAPIRPTAPRLELP